MKYTIELEAADIELIGSLLDEQPFKKVFNLSLRIQAQINAQNKVVSEVASARKVAFDKFVASELENKKPAKRPSKG